MESTLRLFKALPISTDATKTDESLLRETVSRGFIVTPEVIANYSDTSALLALIDKTYGRSGQQLNQSFHKSWTKVRDASDEQLVVEQLVHYLTTYGFESLGIYDQESVYIPREALQLPEFEDGVRLVVIRGLSKPELKNKLIGLLGSGIALGEQTISDVLDVANFVELPQDEIHDVKNKEVKAALYDYFGIVPAQPAEFLRFIIYRATNKTLLIKSAALIDELKERDNLDIVRYFDTYAREYGLARLAADFYRFKPLYLALRTNAEMKRHVNRIRRLARTNHKPMREDLLNAVTSKLAHGEDVLGDEFAQALATASTFRKIRLAYALKFRTTDANSILYRIRNGKSFATQFSFARKEEAEAVLDRVRASIVADVAKNVTGKKIFIPAGIKYGLPATEKQFTGHLPSGTYVEVPHDMVAGIHWENVGNHRIDLDLSVMNAEVGKIGWDSTYRTEARDVLFSGDMTDAPKPNGASELFYFAPGVRGTFIVFVNYYNHMPNVQVPYRILVAQQKPITPNQHYMVDPNAIVAVSNAVMENKQRMLGIVHAADESIRFYFAEAQLGKGRSVQGKEYINQARNFLLNFYTDTLVLNDVLLAAGAELVKTADEADIDLSPESIDKATIIGLLQRANI